MSNTDRRSFIRGGLRAALGTGGLLLPWQGGGVLALPNLGGAPQVPVTSGPFPVSDETLELRRIVERRRHINAMEPGDARSLARITRMLEYQDVANVILDRPVSSWGQVAEIAEIAWCCTPKVWYGRMPGQTYGMLDLDGRQNRNVAHWHLSPAPCLIAAVMQLTGAPRLDTLPQLQHEPILDRRLTDEELSALCTQGRMPGGAHV